MNIEKDELIGSINQLRKELIQIVEETGLNSHYAISCSKKLDQFITIYQKHLQLSYKKENRNRLLADNKDL
ncbi:Spo0E family sporulation regulatory protein-aspartic acid phosphatase [Peribacillus simplex]|uniref:Spo0E family sporulation regulatory protein-aspartic acid phosphatase n=1 Tax=Peribacillus simplex TaxID=1478 RepID=UPI003826D64C